jgi:hypothetical protein
MTVKSKKRVVRSCLLLLVLALATSTPSTASAHGTVLKTWWFSGPFVYRDQAYQGAQTTVSLYRSMGISTHIYGPVYKFRPLAPNGGYYEVHRTPK